MFTLNQDAKISGTSLQGHIKLKLSDIVAVFGQGLEYGDKTTQEWFFEADDGGEVFTLYDWKTNSTPTEEYWWHIGAKQGSNVEGFKDWLNKTIAKGNNS